MKASWLDTYSRNPMNKKILKALNDLRARAEALPTQSPAALPMLGS